MTAIIILHDTKNFTKNKIMNFNKYCNILFNMWNVSYNKNLCPKGNKYITGFEYF